jgi:hypothetical protein
MWSAPLWRGSLQAVERLKAEDKWKVLHLWHTHPPDQIVSAFNDFKPDVILAAGGGFAAKRLRGNFGKALTQWSHVPRGFWMNDLRGDVYGAQLSGLMDRIFLCWSKSYQNPKVARGMNFSYERWAQRSGAKCSYMPQGADHWPVPDKPKIDNDVVFIGNTNPNKWHQGRKVICKYLGAKVLNGERRDQREEIEKGMYKLYRQSQFCLSTSLKVPGYTSVRTYRILAVAGALMLDAFPGAEELFEHKKHALLFHNWEQAANIIKYYKKKDQQLEKIRLAGQRLVHDKHLVYHRVKNMVSNLVNDKSEFWGYR